MNLASKSRTRLIRELDKVLGKPETMTDKKKKIVKMKPCEEKIRAYEKTWSDIDKFERQNPNTAAAKRFGGSHAFNQKKAAMGEMRALLGRLEALKCEYP